MKLQFGTPTEEELFKHHGILRDIMCSQNMVVVLQPDDVERLKNFILGLIEKRSKV